MSSLENADDAIRDLGYYYEEDANVGTTIFNMIEQRLNPLSKEGLESYQANILNNSRIRSILNSFFGPSSYAMARYGNFSSDPKHNFQYLRGGEGEGAGEVLVVQLWAKGSSALYYNRSHHYPLPRAKASNGLFEVPISALKRAGCDEGTTIDFEHGGITIQDAGTVFEIKQGALNASIFATKHVYEKWPAIILPNNPEIRQKFAEISAAQPGLPGLHARLEAAEANVRSPTAPPDNGPNPSR